MDLRNLDLKVEPMSFDGVILSNVLDVMPKDISTIVIDDLEATKYSEPEEYELLKTQEICALIAVPIYANHQMNGFIGGIIPI